jgi:hypothetical protein
VQRATVQSKTRNFCGYGLGQPDGALIISFRPKPAIYINGLFLLLGATV